MIVSFLLKSANFYFIGFFFNFNDLRVTNRCIPYSICVHCLWGHGCLFCLYLFQTWHIFLVERWPLLRRNFWVLWTEPFLCSKKYQYSELDLSRWLPKYSVLPIRFLYSHHFVLPPDSKLSIDIFSSQGLLKLIFLWHFCDFRTTNRPFSE